MERQERDRTSDSFERSRGNQAEFSGTTWEVVQQSVSERRQRTRLYCVHTAESEKKQEKKLDRVCVYGEWRSRLAGKRFSHLASFQPIRGHEAIV